MPVKLKIAKSDTCYFDGTWVSNGYWAVKADRLDLSDKELQSLIRAGVRFSRTRSGLATGEMADPPDFERLIKDASPMKDELLIHQTQWAYESKSEDYGITWRVFRWSDGYLVPFRLEYQSLYDAFSLYQDNAHKAASLFDGEEFVGLVMPGALKRLAEDAKVLASQAAMTHEPVAVA